LARLCVFSRKAYKRPTKAEKARAGLSASSSAVSLKATSSLNRPADKKPKAQEEFYFEVDEPSTSEAPAAASTAAPAGKKASGRARLKAKSKVAKSRTPTGEEKDYVDMYDGKSGKRKH
jgi:hypothetical protein